MDPAIGSAAGAGGLMCGIVGLLRVAGEADHEDVRSVEAMRDVLEHRGPDDAGVLRHGPCVLGHRRLSIVDLAGGHQPMVDAEGRAAVVFNGEIYNHEALRAELEARGHVFSTRSDTEVLLHLYLQDGVRCLERLEGMYAFGIWDMRDQRLLLARDPMGQKPLYWSRSPHAMLFGSELKALLAHPSTPRRIDPAAVRLFLRHDCVPAPWGIYTGIHKLRAGAHLLYDHRTGALRHGRHAELPLDADDLREADEATTDEAIWRAIVQAVERRLMADVPLGVFLSGGIDSTLIVAAMAELREAASIRTFTVGFGDSSYDESAPAAEVARHFGTDHRTEALDPDAALELLPAVLAQQDEPFADPSILPTRLLCAATRQHVTVALGGDGGDELFFGYPTFDLDGLSRALSRAPRWLRSDLPAVLARRLPTSPANLSFGFKARRFTEGLAVPWPDTHFAWITGLPPASLDAVLQPAVAADGADPTDASWAAVRETIEALADRARSPQELIAGAYARLYLGECVLQKVDRASMAVGLEARAPLLDRDVVRLALSAAPRHRRGKGVLRRLVAARGLSPEIVSRPKKGFGVPVAAWIRGPLRGLARDLLCGAAVERSGVLRRGPVEALLQEHLQGRRDHRKALWSLMMYRAWERGPWGPLAGRPGD